MGLMPPTPSVHRLRRGLPGYLIPFAPHAFVHERQVNAGCRFRRWCSSRYLRIPPLHREFRTPLITSSQLVSNDLTQLSQELSRQT